MRKKKRNNKKREKFNTVFFKVLALEKKAKDKKPKIWGKLIIGFFVSVFLGLVIGIATDYDEVAIVLFALPIFLVLLGAGIFSFKLSLTSLSQMLDYNNTLNKWPLFSAEISRKKMATGVIGAFKSPVYNGLLPYHLSLIVLTIVSLYFFKGQNSMMNEAFYSRFTDDLTFQLVSAFLFSILSVFNPALILPEEIKTIMRKKKNKDKGTININIFILNERKFFVFRIIICLLLIALFVFNEWLVFPSLNESNPISIGITVTLVLFVVRNIYMMKRYPLIFLKESLFHFVKILTLLRGAIFILAVFVPLSIFIDEKSNPIPLFFIGFNIIAAYMEYTLIKGTTSLEHRDD